MARAKRVSPEDVEELTDLLSVMVENVVEKPDDINIVFNKTYSSIAFEFDCAPGDEGFVIGENGQTIRAIERIMLVAGAARHLSVSVRFRQERP